MKQKLALSLVAALLLSVTTGLVEGAATGVAVVDVEKAMNSLDQMTQIEADIKTQYERIKEEHTSRRNKLKQLQEDLELLQAGTDAFKQKFDEFQLRAIEAEAWWKFKQISLSSERVLQIGNMYHKLLNTIGKVASENSYSMVMFKEKTPSFRKIKPEALSAIIALRKVLWVSNDLDLTDQVVLRMNNEWKNRR